MAGLNVCKILLVLGALTRHGFGATLDLTVTPTKTSQLSQEDVYISCRPGTSLQAKSILLIKITKSGDSSSLASVYHKQTAAVLYNANTTRGIKAIGHIDDNALLESYLTLTLENPTYEQSGSYECELTYLDVKGELKVSKTSKDVKVMKPDIITVNGVIDDLREDVETNSQDLESVTKELLETKAKLNNQTSYTSSLAKFIKNLEKKIEANAHSFASVTKELHETKAKLQNKKEMKCPNENWTRIDFNLCYKGHNTLVTWKKASEICRKEGATLVSIHSMFQHDRVNKVARSAGFKGNFWIGLNDKAEEGKFVFDDGTKMSSYTNWYKGEPNNTGNDEDCVEQKLSDGIWNDVPCSWKFYFVCQASTRPVDFW